MPDKIVNARRELWHSMGSDQYMPYASCLKPLISGNLMHPTLLFCLMADNFICEGGSTGAQ